MLFGCDAWLDQPKIILNVYRLKPTGYWHFSGFHHQTDCLSSSNPNGKFYLVGIPARTPLPTPWWYVSETLRMWRWVELSKPIETTFIVQVFEDHNWYLFVVGVSNGWWILFYRFGSFELSVHRFDSVWCIALQYLMKQTVFDLEPLGLAGEFSMTFLLMPFCFDTLWQCELQMSLH